MRTYTVTIIPDGIKGKCRTFLFRPSAQVWMLLLSFAALALLPALLFWGLILPFREVAEEHARTVRLRLENEALAAAVGAKRERLEALGGELADQIALLEKVSFWLGEEQWESGGFPPRSGGRYDEMLAAVTYLERRLRYYDRFAELLEQMPIRLPLRDSFVVSSRFGPRLSPFNPKMEMHNGIDFSTPVGSVVLASAGGVVTLAGRWKDLNKPDYARLGVLVRIEHGSTGFSTVYGHCSRLLVRTGDRVGAGQPIALVGDTGWSTSPHLHFIIMRGEKHLDPEDYLLYFDVETVRKALLGRQAGLEKGGR